jgi:hypothetical protein
LTTPANVIVVISILAMIVVTFIIMVQVYKNARSVDVPADIPDLNIGLLPHDHKQSHDDDHDDNNNDNNVPEHEDHHHVIAIAVAVVAAVLEDVP